MEEIKPRTSKSSIVLNKVIDLTKKIDDPLLGCEIERAAVDLYFTAKTEHLINRNEKNKRY